MARLLFFTFSFFFCTCCFCIPGDSIPKDAVKFHSFKNNVILNGYINDTIPIKAMLDIGAWGLAVPERFRKDGENRKQFEQIRFSTGKWAKTMPATFMNANSQFLKWYGDECVLLGWDFFNRRIMEISYKGHYIRELSRRELNGLSGYDTIHYENRGRRLLVNANVTIGGKEIKGKYWIDTGLNGTLFFTHDVLARYNINLEKAKEGRAKNLDVNRTKVNLVKADSIQVGNSLLTDKDVIFSQSEWFVFKENELYVGLIGNQFFKYFSVIFDFRENVLYLKPVGN
ncbi:aspartyl protease family protein [Dysgonomonas sp. 511]|uniref:aspartyl protease family protein n=1 Tax=Dysgonomonas sp. 511 TaxID=2302930 RepID=UPI0013D779C3|nr:aspartyl protease family protein [Dysgonomonas sp. 511]NDV78894.1 hypothetical protein [Dysgonomonas sp. 511]